MPDHAKITKPICLVILVSITILVFYPSLNFELLKWDDDWNIVNNPLIRSLGIQHIIEIFSSTVIGNYQPMTYLSFAVDYYFGGLNPFPYHLHNLLLHIGNVLLVFVLISKLMPHIHPDHSSAIHLFVPFITAVLFAIHPMRVEAVVWATERKEVLYSFFVLMSLIAYLNYAQAKSRKWLFYLLSISLFILACLSKGLAVSMSLVLFLLDYLMKRKRTMTVLLEKIPFLVIALFMGFTIYTLLNEQGEIHDKANVDFIQAVITASYGIVMYIYKLVLPINLSAYYPYPAFVSEGLSLAGLFYLLIVVLATTLIIYFRGWNRIWIMGAGFFLVFIVLVLQFVSVGNTIISERYTYLPYVGLFLIVAYSYTKMTERPDVSRMTKRIVHTLGIVAIAGLAFLCNQRVYAWETSIVLLNDIIDKHPNEFNIHFLRGSAHSSEGNYALAIEDYTNSIDLNPEYYDSYNNRGSAYIQFNRLELAEADFHMVLELEPNDYKGHNNLGTIFIKKGELGKSLSAYSKAIELNNKYVDAYLNRGNLLASMGSYFKAQQDFEKAIDLNPSNSAAYFDRANLALAMGNHVAAIEFYNTSLQLNGSHASAFLNRGKAYFMIKNVALGCNDWQSAALLGNEEAKSLWEKHCN